jgi:magnesium transporter
MPLTFIAGVYGMNFHVIPELSLPYGYPAVLILMAIIAGAMLIYFKKNGWFR